MLAQAVERGAVGGEGGGEVEILVFEDQGCGVEEGVVGGEAGDGEGEGGGVVEGEGEVGGRGGERVGLGRRVVVWRRWRRVLSGEDVVGDFPSLVVGVCYAEAEAVVRLKAGDQTEILNVGSENGRILDELKISSH